MSGSASGGAFLAFCSPADRQTFSEMLEKSASAREVKTEAPITVPRSDLDRIRKAGYATHSSSEGVIALSVPVYDKKYAFACLTVRFASRFVSLEKGLGRFLPPLRSCADEIGELYSNRLTTRPRPLAEEELKIN